MKKIFLALLIIISINAYSQTNNYESQDVLYSGGDNVGINTGTDIPSAKLEVRSVNYSNNQDNGIDLTARHNGVNYWTARLGLKSNSGGSPRFAITTTNRNAIGDITNPGGISAEALSVHLFSGNVGIGSLPDTDINGIKLNVNGTIHCKEVLVDLNFAPDYVFEKYYLGISALKPDYEMPTLEEIEVFTKQNHHLPKVPSAKEIKEEGFNLKEMTTILLQKIEELTLYTIEQEKRIKLLEERLVKN